MQMIQHEKIHIKAEDMYSVWTCDNLNYGPHFHHVTEFCCVLEGGVNVLIGGEKYAVKEGEAIIVMPNQIHSVSTTGHSKIQFIRFRTDFAEDFYAAHKLELPKNSMFEIMHTELFEGGLWQPPHMYKVKAIIYSLLNDLCTQCGGWIKRDRESYIINDLLVIAETEFTEDISLKSVSERLHYNYTYLSTKFSRYIGMSFGDYLNTCRINHACWLLKTTDKSVTEAARECGYNSIRSFNRNFIKYTGMNPTEFKNS